MKQKQRGMTFIGLLFTLAVLGVIVFAVLRLLPVYMEYARIVSVLENVKEDLQGTNATAAEIRKSIESRLYIESVKAVSVGDFQIKKDAAGYRVNLAYDETAPYIANVSFLVSFKKSIEINR